MNTNQTLYFTCPHCEERFAQDRGAGQGCPCRRDLPLQLLRRAGDIPGRVRRGLRRAIQGEEGLLLLQPRTLQVRPINIDRP